MKKWTAMALTAIALGTGISLAPTTQPPAQAVYALPAGTWGGHCYRSDTFVKYYYSSTGQRYQMRHRVDGYYYWTGSYWYCGIRYDYYYRILIT